MQAYLANFQHFLAGLTGGQKATLGTVVVGGILLFAAIAWWAGRPDYALLFGSLQPDDANQIVETLREQNVSYELKEGGSVIYVPRDEVYELRLQFAGEGMVSDGATGYELFDRSTLGMTDFMQKLNMKRALEGELARTITNIRQVEVTRVHLVIPERSPFRETQTQPSASVVLQMVAGASLSAAQIEGIGALVAGAVEGLSAGDVTVLDTRGNQLSNPNRDDPTMLAGSGQLRMQRAVEQHLVEKGQSMLDQVLGPGNALLRVTATLDFERAVTEQDMIDPESATVISEEKLEEDSGDPAAGRNANSIARNYEISRSRQRSEKSVGDVDDMTVSVILNFKKVPPAEEGGAPTYEPYSDQELQEIEQLVKNAVGFKDDRGDRIALHQTRFDTTTDQDIANEMREQRKLEQQQQYIRYGIQLLALVFVLFLIRSLVKRVTTPTDNAEALALNDAEAPLALPNTGNMLDVVADDPAADGEAQDEESIAKEAAGKAVAAAMKQEPEEEVDPDDVLDDMLMRKLSPEARARLRAKNLMFEEIRTEVTDRPEDAAELIRGWLIQDAAATNAEA